MISIEYKCDLCGAVQTKPDQFWIIRLRVDHHPGQVGYDRSDTIKREACRPCVDRLGLIGFDGRDKLTAPTPEGKASFEELVREIAREEIASAVQ